MVILFFFCRKSVKYIYSFFVFFLLLLFRPQEGFSSYRGTFSVMHSRILWWLESGEDVFYPSPGVVHFPLVREEDAPYYDLYFIPPLRRILHVEDESDDDYSDDLDNYDFV